jgi:hypothetical protein
VARVGRGVELRGPEDDVLAEGLVPLSSVQRSALLPTLAAKWIFSPAMVLPVK